MAPKYLDDGHRLLGRPSWCGGDDWTIAYDAREVPQLPAPPGGLHADDLPHVPQVLPFTPENNEDEDNATDSVQAAEDPEGAEITVNVEELSPAVLEEDLPAPEGPVEEPKARSEALTVPLQTPTPAPSRPNTPDSPPEGKSLGRMSSIPRNDGLERSTQEVFRDVMMAMIGQEFPNGESLDPKKLSQEEVLALLKKHHGPVQSHGEGSHTRVFKPSSTNGIPALFVDSRNMLRYHHIRRKKPVKDREDRYVLQTGDAKKAESHSIFSPCNVLSGFVGETVLLFSSSLEDIDHDTKAYVYCGRYKLLRPRELLDRDVTGYRLSTDEWKRLPEERQEQFKMLAKKPSACDKEMHMYCLQLEKYRMKRESSIKEIKVDTEEEKAGPSSSSSTNRKRTRNDDTRSGRDAKAHHKRARS